MGGEIKWYRSTVEEAFSLLESSGEGISEDEAELRLSKYGFNEVEIKKKHGPLYKFAKQFKSPLIYVLLAAAALTFFLDEYADTAVIMGVVLANAVIGFVQENKAEHALESLAKMMKPEATVLREGQRKIIPSRELVAGDVVTLEAGSRVPADMRIIFTRNMRIDESALTGESMAVEKVIDPIQKEDLPLGDQKNMAFGGTLITQGIGKGIVVSTGAFTEIGRISELIQQTKAINTPLLRTIDHLGKLLFMVIVVVSAFTFIIGKLQGFATLDIFLATVSLAVAAIPEGLPALITISLAIGVKTMASRNAIVRNLPSVETLGSATVICSDKTGTLTKNEMTVTEIFTLEGSFDVSGSGYIPQGQFFSHDRDIDPQAYPTLIGTLEAGVLCNDAYMREEGGIDGDPTEGALLVSGLKAGKFHLPRLDTIPFESELRLMATLNERENGTRLIYIKGSPEKIVELCSAQDDGNRISSIQPEFILDNASEMASRGLRVIGMAYKRVSYTQSTLHVSDLNDLVFLGLQGMIDPPREEVKTAIEKCKTAGIRVIMITGDHVLTAHSIAKQLGIRTYGALSGSDLDRMGDTQLKEQLETVSVFARTSPEDKSRIVRLLKEEGEVVAVTGDGINDAPALKGADIGIAMGRSGTEVAKEASDMVLADDNFASIVNAVEEGRDVYNKIQKVIMWTLPTNAAEGLAIMAAVLLGITNPPLLPLHILWINTVTAICLGVPIVFEPREENLLFRRPRDPEEPLLLPIIKRRIVTVALLMVTATFLLFFFQMENNSRDIMVAQTIALNTIVFFEIFYLFNSKSIHNNVFDRLVSNRAMLLGIAIVISLQLLITYNTYLNGILKTAPLEVFDWIIILCLSSSVFFIIEAEKYLMKKGRGIRGKISR
ncbi:magnesium-transporting ATPase (P-type) [Methanohalophilus levihalophilus]|uniref:cation-translocating P-type ATPase n=1 Tax=Methanohalophilus levihalophilus TaxID=1431282 RepID=UPI001AEB0020|nr:HAD-IC family P-type ATPase [Methanohalophilus levihalophilus]MBP2029668.1 magnesium-transporting ATPase (P-type) [Methanohalophilus levihalophilus]